MCILKYRRRRIYQYNEDNFLFQFWFITIFSNRRKHKQVNKENLTGFYVNLKTCKSKNACKGSKQ